MVCRGAAHGKRFDIDGMGLLGLQFIVTRDYNVVWRFSPDKHSALLGRFFSDTICACRELRLSDDMII